MTTQKPSRRRVRRSGRRGIVILIVISLLVLFMLMMVTFAVIAGHYREAARGFAFRRSAQVKFAENNAVMDDILTMILGEPASRSSSLWGNSLLSDMYGGSVNGIVGNAPAAPQLEGAGAFVAFYGLSDTQTVAGAQFVNSEDYYAGCVITMKDGPCAGLSSRITHYYPGSRPRWMTPPPVAPLTYSVDDMFAPGHVNDPIALRMEAFENGLLPQVGNSFVINDKPFNGTGMGRPISGEFANDATDAAPLNFEWALMPHLAGWSSRTAALAAVSSVDEPWDTFDFQNMYLAMVPTQPGSSTKIMPSYHRPELMDYWNTRFDMTDNTLDGTPSLYDSTNPVAVALLRRIAMRPLTADHPAFTGSNPNGAFSPAATPAVLAAAMADRLYRDAAGNLTDQAANGMTPNTPVPCWDVDNDGDGTLDSIWIDPGLPVSIAPDGRRYKRLVAIMIRDMDGRVQLNAHGTTEWAKDFARPDTELPDGDTTIADIQPLAGSPATALAPRGQGFGPAEINFSNLFEIDGGPSPLLFYQRMFQGTAANPFPPMTPVVTAAIPGRYGLDTYPLLAGYDPLNRRPGIWGPNGSAVISNDALSVIKAQGFGYDYNGTVFSNYATPSDIWGRGAIALDYAGQPYPYSQAAQTDWDNDGTADTVEIIDNPYEINLIDGPQSYDSPYTVAEQERLLRRFDADADVLPQRLYEFLNTSGNPVTLARRINTTSVLGSSISSPRGVPPRYMREDPGTYGMPGASILEICEARVGVEPTSPADRSDRQHIVKQLMPFEFYQGQMFNLNRPFGNGVDDNGNGVVDEPGESDNINGPLEPAWTSGLFAPTPLYPTAATSAAYLLNDAQNHWWDPGPLGSPYADANYSSNLINTNPHLYARQLFARNLYCLLMLNCDLDNFVPDTGAANPNYPNPETLPVAQLRKLFCRRLAQYAINVVDFRDPDAIMTPFEYDEYPFDGWHVDGDLTTDENNLMGMTDRAVVWGMEQQEVVLKETISFHDRRVRDTAHDDNMPPSDRGRRDPTLDQLRLPQGSTFIELLCTRARVDNNVKLPVELYNATTGRLELAKMAPPSTDGAARPVWQIAISENVFGAGTDNRPNTLSTAQPDTFSLEPTLNPGVAPVRITASIFKPGPTQFVPIERYVWFTNAEPAAATGQADNTFINSQGWDVSLNPGSYLVIGPRVTTSLGSEVTAAATPMYDGPSPQTITLTDPTGAGLAITNIAGAATALTPGDQIRQAVAMVADIHPPRSGVATIGGPTAWPAARRIGLNVTEPLPQSGRYYTFPTNPNDAYDDLMMPTMNTFPDDPFDSTPNMPLEDAGMLASKTYAGTHTMVLQRLANPLLAWDPVTNPYINLDWAENDTTVFSGDEDTDRQVMDGTGAMVDVDPDDPTPHDPAMFRTRQRGNTNTAAGYANGMLWNPQTTRPTAPASETAESPAAVYFKHSLVHTFGFVNGIYRDPGATPPAQDESVWPRTPGVPLVGGIASPLWNFTVAKRVPTDPDVPANYVGDPSLPFPWITHNNRPFANPMEMLVVPASSPQRIGQEFLYASPGDTYNASNGPTTVYGLYWHLPNFFLSTLADPAGGILVHGSDLNGVFDYVETPSPYVGAERWYSPPVVNGMGAGDVSTITQDHVGTGYRAPFNRLSRFRDPGKVNINTIVDPLVWDAIVATFQEMQSANGWETSTTSGAPLFAQILQSRRGYATGADAGDTTDMFRRHPEYPTIVANPFRPADTFDLQPLDYMRQVRPADATLLRGNGTPLPLVSSDPPTPGDLPLFNFNQYNVNLADSSTFDQFGRATDRNAYFHYQPYAKLANMLTTNSNTFAVWMTVGYFEVEPNPAGVDTAHPDGYRLGQEMLFDGVVRRPRAFFLIDRSIPVGFEPGQALNTDKCVLQRRYIE